MEIWKPIKHNNNYMVSNEGRIKSLKYRNTNKEHILACYGKEYKMVKISKGNTRKDYFIHKLVAEAFIPNPDNLPCINHINGIKTDNRVENLEWCSYSHNIREAFRLGLSHNKTGKGNGRSKAVDQYSIDGKFIKRWESMRQAEITLKILHIHEVCQGKRKTIGGYIWRYANDM